MLIAGGAVGAVASHHGDERDRGGSWADSANSPDSPNSVDSPDSVNRHGRGTRADRDGEGGPDSAGLAPAPLPALPAGQAADKALSAVPGGRVASVDPVAEQGGGTAWRVVVLGTDGVRHAVTIDGAGGTVTGNTVTNSTAITGNSGKE